MMLKLAREGALFAGRVPEQLHGPVWPFDASFVARIHGDETHDLRVTADLIHQAFGYRPDTLPYGARANVRMLHGNAPIPSVTMRHASGLKSPTLNRVIVKAPTGSQQEECRVHVKTCQAGQHSFEVRSTLHLSPVSRLICAGEVRVQTGWPARRDTDGGSTSSAAASHGAPRACDAGQQRRRGQRGRRRGPADDGRRRWQHVP